MSKTKKGTIISIITPIVWLLFAVILPNFQRYNEPDFNKMLQLFSYCISIVLLILFLYGISHILTGVIEKRKR